jgi:hypothetical protein
MDMVAELSAPAWRPSPFHLGSVSPHRNRNRRVDPRCHAARNEGVSGIPPTMGVHIRGIDEYRELYVALLRPGRTRSP